MKRSLLATTVFLLVALLVASCAKATPAPPPPAPAAIATPALSTPTPAAPKATPAAIPAPVATTPATPAKPKPEGVLRVGHSWGEEILDPVGVGVSGKGQLSFIYDWVVGLALDGQDISPDTGLAYKWEQGADGLSWTFYLRKGVQFDKGYGEVTAEDVKFSISRTIYTVGTFAVYGGALKAVIQEIQVVDPYTIRFALKSPRLSLPYDLSRIIATEGVVYPKKYVETVGDKEFRINPIGSGPYRLVKQEPGLYMKFEARDDYWQFIPRFKEVYLYKLAEEASRLAMLKRGELDVAQVTIPRIAELEAAGFKVYEKPGIADIVVWMHNQWEGYVSDKRVRLALNLAVNKDELNKALFNGKGQLLPGGGLPTWALGARRFAPFPYDPKRAKELLAEAGYPRGFELEFIPAPPDPMPLVAQAVAGYLDAVGVKTKIFPMDYAARTARWRKFDMKDVLSPKDFPNRQFTQASYRNVFHSKGDTTMIRDPQLDSLIEGAEKARTMEEFARYQGEVQQYFHDNVSAIFLLEAGEFYAVSPKLVLKDWKAGGRSTYEMGAVELTRR